MLNPDSASHTCKVLSSEPDTIFLPSGEKATDVTQSVWPVKGPRTLNQDSASYTCKVLSSEPDTIFLPSEEKATDVTTSVWPFRVSTPESQGISSLLMTWGTSGNADAKTWDMADSAGTNGMALW